MTYGVFSARDNKSSFGQIWYDRSVDAAKRGFAMMVNFFINTRISGIRHNIHSF